MNKSLKPFPDKPKKPSAGKPKIQYGSYAAPRAKLPGPKKIGYRKNNTGGY